LTNPPPLSTPDFKTDTNIENGIIRDTLYVHHSGERIEMFAKAGQCRVPERIKVPGDQTPPLIRIVAMVFHTMKRALLYWL
jgi:hypothetical protein